MARECSAGPSNADIVTTSIRKARESDREALATIGICTIRASYSSFLGTQSVDAWIASGAVETYFDENLPSRWAIEENGGMVGFSVTKGAVIDLMMIDCNRHREGFGRVLLDHVETHLFAPESQLTLESFFDNDAANAFYAAAGWTRGEAFEDPEDGIAKVPCSKRRSAGAS